MSRSERKNRMGTRRIIVAGSRTCNDYNLISNVLSRYVRYCTENGINPEFVSGGCRGVDTLAERFCKLHGYPIKVFNADWATYGKRAGYLRNKQMAEYAAETGGSLIAFWDGKSRGIKMMIELAEGKGLTVNVNAVS